VRKTGGDTPEEGTAGPEARDDMMNVEMGTPRKRKRDTEDMTVKGMASARRNMGDLTGIVH
jgi:hypothetical protein